MRQFNNYGEKEELAELKSNQPFQFSVIKKTIVKATAIVLSWTAIAGMVLGFAGCSRTPGVEPGIDAPGIVEPAPGTDNPEPGIDPSEPGIEDPGIVDPEPEPQPEPEPEPSEPGTEKPEIDEPEPQPDPQPTIDDIDTIDELFMEEPFYTDFDSEEEYNEAKVLYDLSQEAQGVVLKTLNDNLLEKMATKIGTTTKVENLEEIKWEINTTEDDKTIKNIRVYFFNHSSETTRSYCISNVTPKNTLTLNDLLNPDVNKLNEAFDTNMYFGARYAIDYIFSYNPSVQERRGELKDAINAKLASDSLIKPINEETLSFVKDNGSDVEPALGGIGRDITILNITGNSYEEISLRILNADNDSGLIENLNNSKYITYGEESATFSDNTISQDLQEQAKGYTSVSYHVIYKDPDIKEEYVLGI